MDIYFTNYRTIPLPSVDGSTEEFNTELTSIDPENVLESLSKNTDEIKEYISCYAAQKELKNCYLIRSDIDINLEFDSLGHIRTDRFGQKFYDLFINTSGATINLTFNNIFFSKDSVEVVQLPAIYHDTPFDKDFYPCIGSYDISKWFRPLNAGYINKDLHKQKSISIKRGDPLFYVKFNTDSKVRLKKFEFTDHLYHKMTSCTSVKLTNPKLNLQKLYNIFRSNNFNSRILKEIKNNLI